MPPLKGSWRTSKETLDPNHLVMATKQQTTLTFTKQSQEQSFSFAQSNGPTIQPIATFAENFTNACNNRGHSRHPSNDLFV